MPSDATVKSMRANRTGNRLELAFRRALRGRGFQFDVKSLPGRPDAAHAAKKLAVFLHGCFWHGCPEHGRIPKANAAFWSDKFQKNRARDQRVARQLRGLGWSVTTLWEHEFKEDGATRLLRLA